MSNNGILPTKKQLLINMTTRCTADIAHKMRSIVKMLEFFDYKAMAFYANKRQVDYDFRWATDTANRKVQAMMSAATAEGDN